MSLRMTTAATHEGPLSYTASLTSSKRTVLDKSATIYTVRRNHSVICRYNHGILTIPPSKTYSVAQARRGVVKKITSFSTDHDCTAVAETIGTAGLCDSRKVGSNGCSYSATM